MWHKDIPESYRNQIVTGDARKLVKAIPDDCASLMFCDPPYWVNFKYGSGVKDSAMDKVAPDWIVNEGLRIASCALVTPGIANLRDYPSEDWLYCWYKPGSTRRSSVLNGFNTWEPILVYGKPAKRVYQDSSYLPSVSSLNDKSANFHGCPKPLKLLIELITRFTNPDDVVIDFMVGSGTTAIAAKITGRNYIAFEIDPATADLARERVRNTQPPLIVPQHEQMAFEIV